MAILYDEKGNEHYVPHAIDVRDWVKQGYSLEKPKPKPKPKAKKAESKV